jgi:sulfite exporter TauE/SafE
MITLQPIFNTAMAEVIESVHEPEGDHLLLFVFGIVVSITLILYSVTWAIVKKILHKKHPKLIGFIAVIIFIFIVSILYYRITFGYFG